ncbi:MAG: methyltransferase, partial [Pseudomonadota bacterium]|nr:methyltransferase [Pseudomonadota bacterium]
NQLTQVQILQSDWMSSVEGSFDCIISNPPYIAEHDPHLAALTHEPRQALVSGHDGLTDIRQIIAQAQAQLNNRGVLLFEHGYNQHQQVQNLMKQAGFHSVTSGKDYGDNWRWTLGHKA